MNVFTLAGTTAAPPRTYRSIPLFARLSGRDSDLLAELPDDIRTESAGVGLTLLIAAIIHWVGFVAAFYIMNVPLQLAAVLSTVTAIGLFSVDRAAIHAFDHAAAETTVRRSKATDLPRLVGWFSHLLPLPLRIGFSVLTALFTGMALLLFVFEQDLDERNARLQIDIDQPFIAAATTTFGAERAALVRAQQEAEESLASHDDVARLRDAERQDQIARLEEEVNQLHGQVASLRDTAGRSGAEARRQRDLARCELEPGLPNCGGASGVPGDGPRYRAALERAVEAEGMAATALVELSNAQVALQAAEMRLNQVFSSEPSSEHAAVRAELSATAVAAADAIGRFDAGLGARVAEEVANNPLRRLIDPDSLSARLHALQLLAQEDLGVFGAMLTIKAVAFALELLALLKLAYMKPSEYHLRRGERFVAEMVRVRNNHHKRFLEDAGLREAVRRKTRDEANNELADDIFAHAQKTARSTITPLN